MNKNIILDSALGVLSAVILSASVSSCATTARELTEPSAVPAKVDGSTADRSATSDRPVHPTTPRPTTREVDAVPVATYVNRAYGFFFRYPTSWVLMEGKSFVSLRQGTTKLVVGYRHITEDRNICCRSQLPEGKVVDAGSVTCAGEAIDRALLTCEGDTKAVIYHGSEEVAVGDLRFLFYVEDFNVDYEAAAIPEDVQAEVDRIIRSLETFEPVAEFATSTPRPTGTPRTPEPTAGGAKSVGSTAAPTTPTPPTATSSPGVAEAVAGGANVRSGPGTDHGLAGSLEGGERVEIIGQHDDWWQIVYEGRPAWVYDGVVTVSNTGAVTQIVSVPTPVPRSPTTIPSPAPPSAMREERWIDVDLAKQRLTAYEDGQPVRTTLVSTGLPRTPTVRGQFRIWIKLRYDDMEGPDYHLEDVPHVMYFYEGYGLHAAPWHNNFGQRMSHGCVNLPVPEAAWLFKFAGVGTLVNVR